MAMDSPKRPFTRETVVRATELFGVYALWDADEIIYIGKADIEEEGGIRVKLERHLAGKYSEETARATHFQEEFSSDPSARRAKLLEEYLDKHGRYPLCNMVRQQK